MEELKELLKTMSWEEVSSNQDVIISGFAMLYPEEATQLEYPLTEAGYKYIKSVVCNISDEPEEPSEDTYYSSAAEYAEQIAQANEELAVAEEKAIEENINKEEKQMANKNNSKKVNTNKVNGGNVKMENINVQVNGTDAEAAQKEVDKINSVDWNTIIKELSTKCASFRRFIKGLAGNNEEEFLDNLYKNKDKLFKEMKKGLDYVSDSLEDDAEDDVPGAENKWKKLLNEREKFVDIIHDDDKLLSKIGRLLKSFLLLLAKLFIQAIKLAFKIVKPLAVAVLRIVVIAVDATISLAAATYKEVIKPAYGASKKAVADFKGKRAAAKVGVNEFLDDEYFDDED